MSALDHVVLQLPFRGTWVTRNSPARRVPSHGTDLFATTYAVDFVAVRGRRTATTRDWRTVLSTEPPERFFAFGQPILAPADGQVVAVHRGYVVLAHLQADSIRIGTGDSVVAGQELAICGNSGNSTQPQRQLTSRTVSGSPRDVQRWLVHRPPVCR